MCNSYALKSIQEKEFWLLPTNRLNSSMTLLSEEIPFDTVMFLSNKSSAASAFLRTAYLAGGDEFGSSTFRNIFLTMEKNYTNAIRYPTSTWADLLDPVSASRVRTSIRRSALAA